MRILVTGSRGFPHHADVVDLIRIKLDLAPDPLTIVRDSDDGVGLAAGRICRVNSALGLTDELVVGCGAGDVFDYPDIDEVLAWFRYGDDDRWAQHVVTLARGAGVPIAETHYP